MTATLTTAMNAVLRVLIVEDDARYRGMLTTMLRDLSCDAEAAASANEARAWLENHHADVILLDLNMPREDGLEFLATLRQHDQATPVMILTGVGTLESAQIAIRYSVSEFLTKPCHMGVLEAALNRVRLRMAEREHNLAAIDPIVAGGCPDIDNGPEAAATTQTMAQIEQAAILAALVKHGGNRTAAANALGISRRTLHYRLVEYRQAGLVVLTESRHADDDDDPLAPAPPSDDR